MSQHNTLTRALQEIADWNSHTTEFAVDYGSNGVRDFYRGIARAALSATQPAQAAQGEPVQGVPDGWEIREDDTWIYFKRPDGFCQAVTPNDPHTSHAQTLHMLMRAMLTSAPTPPAQPAVAQGAGEVVAWVDVHDRTNLYYRKPPQVDVRPLTYADTQPAAGADVRDELQKLPQIASTAMHQDARDMRNILEDIANRLRQLTANDRAAIAASGRQQT